MTHKQMKKLYDQAIQLDKHVPGWQVLPDKVARTLWKAKLEYYANKATRKGKDD